MQVEFDSLELVFVIFMFFISKWAIRFAVFAGLARQIGGMIGDKKGSKVDGQRAREQPDADREKPESNNGLAPVPDDEQIQVHC